MKSIIVKCTLLSVGLLLSGCGGGSSVTDTPQITPNPEPSIQETPVPQEPTPVPQEPTPVPQVSSNQNEKKAPIANAGADTGTGVNTTISLTGDGSDEDGTIVAYKWEKGTELLGDNQTLEYTPTEIGTETLTLTVTDNDGLSGSDTVSIVSFTMKQE